MKKLTLIIASLVIAKSAFAGTAFYCEGKSNDGSKKITIQGQLDLDGILKFQQTSNSGAKEDMNLVVQAIDRETKTFVNLTGKALEDSSQYRLSLPKIATADPMMEITDANDESEFFYLSCWGQQMDGQLIQLYNVLNLVNDVHIYQPIVIPSVDDLREL